MPGVAEELAPSVLGELAHIRAVLEATLLQDRGDMLALTFGPFQRQELVLIDGPGPKMKRLIIPRPGQGGIITINTTITPVVEENEGRLGGLIVNTGITPVRLVFCRPGEAGGAGAAPSGQSFNRPCTTLAAAPGANGGGGTFDFRAGNGVYGGPIIAYSTGGAGQLDWAEF